MENLKEKKMKSLKMKNLLEEKNKTSYCQNATAFVQRSARLSRDTGLRLKCPPVSPPAPFLRALGVSFFFVRIALKKKRTGIHKMLLYSFIFSPQIVHRKKEKQTTKNNVKVKKERKNPPCPLKKTLMKMKKNERLIEKKTCSFPLLTFFDRMMIFLLNCERRKV